MTLASPQPDAPSGNRANIIFYDEYERQRIDHLVFGRPRPKPGRNKARKGKVAPIVRLVPGVEEAVRLREEYSHKAQGTPETITIMPCRRGGYVIANELAEVDPSTAVRHALSAAPIAAGGSAIVRLLDSWR